MDEDQKRLVADKLKILAKGKDHAFITSKKCKLAWADIDWKPRVDIKFIRSKGESKNE